MQFDAVSAKKRLEKGKWLSFTYKRDNLQGLIKIWKHNESLILTWEECPSGEQYDESKYTKDLHFKFQSFDELLEFIISYNLFDYINKK